MAKKKILIVDDERELVQIIQIRLEQAGHEVIAAYDGQEGLEKACEHRPDLIILDVSLPKMDGYTCVRELKKRSGGALPPILILTGRSKCQDLFALEGIKDYMVKPFDHQEFFNKVDALLKGEGEN